MKLYGVIDNKAEVVCMTFSTINDATARRSFEDLIANVSPSVFTSHPEDFSLYHICEIDLKNTVPSLKPCVVKVCSGGDYSSLALQTLREERIKMFAHVDGNIPLINFKEEMINE